MRFLMLAALLPAATAAFDQCARPTAEWVGFDQGHGSSYGYTVAYSNGNLYIGGESKGSLSFGSKHTDGTYSDHEGTSATHDTHADVTIHHETGTFAATGGSSNTDPASSQLGQDATIYKISEAGVPLKVFGADTLASDGNVNGTGENGKYGGWSYFYGLDAFDAEPDVVAGVGMYRGALKFPMADNSDKTLLNRKYMSKDGFVAKIDMTTGKAVWATDDGLKIDAGVAREDSPKQIYGRDVATTGQGHVIAVSDIRSPYVGLITKHNGADGKNLWAAQFPEIYNMFVQAIGDEMAYVTGAFKGTNAAWMAGATGVCDGGEGKSAFIAAFDVSPDTVGPVAKWMTQVGCGDGQSVRVVDNFLYVAGRLSAAATVGTCAPLTGTQGGYLAKLNKADGTCVWARDTPSITRAISDGTHVWTYVHSNGKMTFDDDTILYGDSDRDTLIAKYDASDGAGLWAETFGGSARDNAHAAVMTPTGPVFVGSSKSESNAVGDLAITNLQKQRVDADTTSELNLQYGMTVTKLSSVEQAHSCITNCPSGKLTDATIDANFCYIEGKCIAHDAPSPRLPCFKCNANADQRQLPATFDTSSYCFISDVCRPSGEAAPHYQSYNSYSVCEQCNPAVSSTGWSLKRGYFHDRDFARNIDGRGGSPQRNSGSLIRGPNNYGMLFQKNTGGCQLLPEITMPASPTNNLDAALKNPTSGDIAAVGARVTSAFAMIESATKENQGAEIVAAWYHANPATCTKVDDLCPTESAGGAGGACVHSDVCAHTPAAHADAMAVAFETNLHYGHSVARIKVMQALAILANDLATGTTTANMADIKKDVLAHMLVPMYQGAIEAANRMDNSATAGKGLADFAAYWNVIKDKVTFHAHDKGRLDALAAMEASAVETNNPQNNLCTVRTLLHRNLPDGSKLQYHHDWIPCPDGGPFAPCPGAKDTAHAKDVTGVHHLKAEAAWDSESETKTGTEAVHLQERDIGTLKAVADSEGNYPACVMPPPAPPPPAPPPSPAPAVESSDSGLTDGEIAGVAVGAAVGGIVLLGVVGLILRSLIVKDAKPVFTCLEKSDAKPPA